jgi:cobalt-precorrin 5A hydrolase
MVMGEAMMVAGIGCRRNASADAIIAAIEAALDRNGLSKTALDVIATSIRKGDEPGIAAAAAALGLPLVLVEQSDLEAVVDRTMTQSERVAAMMGVPSVAEAAALAAAGTTARLVAPRVKLGPATCALADADAGASAP